MKFIYVHHIIQQESQKYKKETLRGKAKKYVRRKINYRSYISSRR